MAITSFACRDTAALFAGRRIPRFAAIETVAVRKLQQVHAAATLSFLRASPGHRLEPFNGNLAGSYSIRVNAQWRIGFDFAQGEAAQVRIVDYH
ncbi:MULTISPECIES: type II toxin-antitoxin system RelE/ParE family toxin [Paraburkholderia]|uniref:Proteic killer suppression protein n=1 Tax=Paraburkholderia tropica TaxID=92647 RepID=A0A1A5XKK6_9BURK|nr:MULTISPECIES: type II toxin-antitoxin system RelE/ParE family toxin [Paraburkholderia]MBB2979257.1 proteic killer suppression protein [Paraburkholderia tropica]MBB3001952.1 proteic killer suppression protein [Paraburkholderia tropica]MBB6321336.1 proteic killer suppression protein [Paraburkholderia tropica]OBR53643.1 excinuclease ABC subunit A [Paraburkholderia tropica]RQM49828.1 excinuclease ABC subunit A [Paraburkholderia bannensis]